MASSAGRGTSGAMTSTAQFPSAQPGDPLPRGKGHAAGRSSVQPKAPGAGSSQKRSPGVVSTLPVNSQRAHDTPSTARPVDSGLAVSNRIRDVDAIKLSAGTRRQASDVTAASQGDGNGDADPHARSFASDLSIYGTYGAGSTAKRPQLEEEHAGHTGVVAFVEREGSAYSPECSPSGMLSDVTSPSHSGTPTRVDPATGWVGMEDIDRDVSWLRTPLGLSFEHKKEMSFDRIIAVNKAQASLDSSNFPRNAAHAALVAPKVGDERIAGDLMLQPSGGKHANPDAHSDWSDPHATELDIYCQCDCACIYEVECRRRCGLGSIHSGGTNSMRSGSCGSIKASSRRSSGAAPPVPFSSAFGPNHAWLDFPPSRTRDAFGGQVPLLDFLQDPDHLTTGENKISGNSRAVVPPTRAYTAPSKRIDVRDRRVISGEGSSGFQSTHTNREARPVRRETSRVSNGRELAPLALEQHDSAKARTAPSNGRRHRVIEPQERVLRPRGSAEAQARCGREPGDDPGFVDSGRHGAELRERDTAALGAESRPGSKRVSMMPRNWSMPGKKEVARQHRPQRQATLTAHSRSFTEGSSTRQSRSPHQMGDEEMELPTPGVAQGVRGGVGGDRMYAAVGGGGNLHRANKGGSQPPPPVREGQERRHRSRRSHQQHHHHQSQHRRRKQAPESSGSGLVGTIRRFLRM
jgi:hypothetical protein